MNHMKHPGEEQLVLHYYGEADDPQAVEAHFAACSTCRVAFESIQTTLNAIPEPEVPFRPEHYGEQVWARLKLKSADLHVSKSADRIWWLPRFAVAAAAIALPLVGFLVGLLWSKTAPAPAGARPGIVAEAGGPPEQVRERILMGNVGDHLERSQMALVELVNAEVDRPVDISVEQTWVEDLLAANRLYRQTASEDGNTAVADLLDELERVLVEIARSPSTISAEDLGRLRTRIEERSLLFKVRVLGNRIREDAQRPVTQPIS